MSWYFFICRWPNNSLKSHVFWRSSSLHIDELYNSLKNWSFCLLFKNMRKGHWKKYIEFWDTLYQKSDKCLQGIIVCKFWRETLIQVLQVIANCELWPFHNSFLRIKIFLNWWDKVEMNLLWLKDCINFLLQIGHLHSDPVILSSSIRK